MDVFNEIIKNSGLSLLSTLHKNLVLLLFSVIIVTLFAMLIILLGYGSQMTIQFGY
jgi:hypothetical protein